MLSLARVLKDHRDAGSLAAQLNLWGFINDTMFLTKSGAVGTVLRIRGVDFECLDHVQRRHIAHRFESATRVLDTQTRLYQYLCKRRLDDVPASTHAHPIVNAALERRRAYLRGKQQDLYQFAIYYVLVDESWTTRLADRTQVRADRRRGVRHWLSLRQVAQDLGDDLEVAVRRLDDRCTSFVEHLADTVAPERLDKRAAFQVFRQLLNYAPHKGTAALKYDTYLDFFVADSSLTCHRTHLELDDYHVKVLTLKEPPAQTFANMLEDVFSIPGEYIACSEWRRLENGRMRADIRSRRRHFHTAKTSMVNYVSSDTRPEEMLVDDSAAATVAQLGQALTELEVHGHHFGEFGLSLVLFDRDAAHLQRSVATAIKTFAAHDASLFEETYNLVNAWLAVLPGHASYNVRRVPVLQTNFADLSFLYTLDSGSPISPHLQREYLAMFETRHQTPHYFQMHVGDVGHTLILGATGSGKSFLLNFLTTHVQKYDPITIIFDIGGSYQKLTRLLGGAYWPIGLRRQDFQINPFCLDPTPENLHFLASFVRVLLQSGGQYRTTLHDDRAVYDAIESLYHVDRPLRRLSTIAQLLPRPLAPYLSRWVGEGPYAPAFDNVEDTLTFAECQTFDFQEMQNYPLVLEALWFYILHRSHTWVYNPALVSRLKWIVIDEAWRFALDDTIRRYMTESLKTGRKWNASMILATQSSDDLDLTNSSFLRTVVESCPTQVFLANPGLDVEQYQRLFHLTQTEARLIGDLTPRREVLVHRAAGSRVLRLDVDRLDYWIYTNTPQDNERVAAVLQEHGVEAGLALLAQAS